MRAADIGRFCSLGSEARVTLQDAHDRLRLTARGHYRLLRVARTLADLDGRDRIERKDVAEAVGYRAS
jgi:magnesium chelatase family protein